MADNLTRNAGEEPAGGEFTFVVNFTEVTPHLLQKIMLQSDNGWKKHLEASNTNSYLEIYHKAVPEVIFPFWGIWFHDIFKRWRHKKPEWKFPSWSTIFILMLCYICTLITLFSFPSPLPVSFWAQLFINRKGHCSDVTRAVGHCQYFLQLLMDAVTSRTYVHIFHNTSLADVKQTSHNLQCALIRNTSGVLNLTVLVLTCFNCVWLSFCPYHAVSNNDQPVWASVQLQSISGRLLWISREFNKTQLEHPFSR